MTLEFRQAQSSDLPMVRQITENAYSTWLPVLGYPPQPMTEDHAPRIARGEVFLACCEKDVCGLIVIESDNDDHDLIFSVAVDPIHAGNRIGQFLISEAEQRARANKKTSIKLYTNALMERNIVLYAKLGYMEKGRRPNPARPCFTIVDMEKKI